MDPTEESAENFESREDLVRLILAAGHTMPSEHQLERWRGEGLLASVRQVQTPYRGSRVEFPNGTAKQIIEIQRLLNIKKSLDFVGWELWWSGYPVDEKWWKPKLINSAKIVNRILRWVKIIQRREDRHSDDILGHPDTIFDRLPEIPKTNNMFSRINRRIDDQQSASLIRIFAEVGDGNFENFADIDDQSAESDQYTVIAALDINDTNSYNPVFGQATNINPHIVMGKRLNLAGGISSAFAEISRSLSSQDPLTVEQFSDAQIVTARDDFRHALHTAIDLYEATNWVFGKRAFGLRLVNWIFERPASNLKPICILGFAMLRRSGDFLESSSNIAKLASAAARLRVDSLKLRDIAENNPVWKSLLTPKNIRRSLLNKTEYELFLAKIQDRRKSINEFPPSGHANKLTPNSIKSRR